MFVTKEYMLLVTEKYIASPEQIYYYLLEGILRVKKDVCIDSVYIYIILDSSIYWKHLSKSLLLYIILNLPT